MQHPEDRLRAENAQLVIQIAAAERAMQDMIEVGNKAAAEIERLRAALKPFAESANNYADCADERFIDEDATVAVSHLRDARAAYEQKG